MKIGNKIRIRKDLKIGFKYGGLTWQPGMANELSGRRVTISRISHNMFDSKEIPYTLTFTMIDFNHYKYGK